MHRKVSHEQAKDDKIKYISLQQVLQQALILNKEIKLLPKYHNTPEQLTNYK